MTIQFQEQVLKYLLQYNESKKYVGIMDNTCFEQPSDKIIFDLLQGYVTKFNVIPSMVSFIEWWHIQAKQAGVKEDMVVSLVKRIKVLYQPMTEETKLIKHSLVEFTQRLQTKHLFLDNVDKVKEGDEKFFNQLHRKMVKISKIGEEGDEEKNKGGFLLKDWAYTTDLDVEGVPIDLKAINRMTASGGFYSPQLIVLMGAPKSFKTGTMLNIALGLMRDGYKVYYADTENGIGAIRTRAAQAMLQCTRAELKDLKAVAREVVSRWDKMGGDMIIDFYPARSKNLGDVDERLEELKAEGWMPDFIFYDYLDLFEPENSKVVESRFKIQNVYHHAVRINNKYNAAAFTVSPVSRGAVSKEVINMKDFSEDFAKAYNCHAAYAICQTEEETTAGLARIVPVAQRDGTQYKGDDTTCYVRIEHPRMILEELDRETYSQLMDDAIGGRIDEKKKRPTNLRNGKRKLEDE